MELFGLSLIVILTILIALAFDFVNGFHDSANAIATVVATKVLTPVQAVSMAAFFNFVGPFVFSLAVANTVGKTINAKVVTGELITIAVLGALIGAVIWDLVTWWFGLPTSSSHALVGGLVGGGMAVAGTGAIVGPGWHGFLTVELVGMGKFLLYGIAGGLLAIPAALAISRIRLPRFFLMAFIAVGVFGGLYFAFTNYDDSHAIESKFNFVIFGVMGLFAGALLWAMTQHTAKARDLLALPVLGAAVAFAVGVLTNALKLSGLTKTILFMVVSPVLGLFLGFLMAVTVSWLMAGLHPGRVDSISKRAQLFSSAFYALTHGTNDAQKTMGVIGLLLFGSGAIGLTASGNYDIPTWVIIVSAGAMGLGTLFGGWRIVETMAARITALKPIQGFAAETGGGLVLTAMAQGGIPVSTTHAISSSIMGVGATHRLSAVRWGVGRRIVAAWLLTMPASAVIAYLSSYLIAWTTGGATQSSTTAWGLFVVLVVLTAVYAMYKRRPRQAEAGEPLLGGA